MRRLPVASLLLLPVFGFCACAGVPVIVFFVSPLIPLAISPGELAEAQIDSEYEAKIEVSRRDDLPVGGITVISGSLPPGLTLSHKNGQNTATISGRPQAAGEYSFTIRAWCLSTMVSGRTGQRSYTLVVK
ncbi:MAG: Ig domain-containing protein [Fimbriiglobus sp.]